MDQVPERPPEDGEPIPVLPGDLAPELSEIELVADIWSADARAAREAAMRAVAIARLARRRRIESDREFGSRGGPGSDARALRPAALAEVSETFIPELAQIRGCSEWEAEQLAVEAVLLTTRLTGTWSALHEGRIDVRKMQALVDLLAPAKAGTVAEVERRVLPVAPDLTVAQLRERVRRILARIEADALEQRRRAAELRADVTLQRTGDGMGRVAIDLPLPRAAALVDAVDQYARTRRADGDRRPLGVLRAECAGDLVLRPWDTSRPPVTAHVVVHAPLPALRPPSNGSPRPACDIAGEVVTAAQCRELLTELGMLGLGSPPPGGSLRVAVGDPVTGRLVVVATPPELRRAAGLGRRRRGRRDRERAPADDDGPGLRPPPPTDRYCPTAAQETFVEIRDRHCRMPGCRRRAARCDIDHGTAHADGGPTDCWNLCCLCRRHHRIKTFARGWRFDLLADGRLVVRTPSGVSRTTRPPGWCWDPEPDPPWQEEQAPPDRARA